MDLGDRWSKSCYLVDIYELPTLHIKISGVPEVDCSDCPAKYRDSSDVEADTISHGRELLRPDLNGSDTRTIPSRVDTAITSSPVSLSGSSIGSTAVSSHVSISSPEKPLSISSTVVAAVPPRRRRVPVKRRYRDQGFLSAVFHGPVGVGRPNRPLGVVVVLVLAGHGSLTGSPDVFCAETAGESGFIR